MYGLTRDYLGQHPEVPTAVICGPDRGRGEFTVRLRPSGREFSAISWRAFWDRLASYRGEGGRWPLVDFESDAVWEPVKNAWAGRSDSPR